MYYFFLKQEEIRRRKKSCIRVVNKRKKEEENENVNAEINYGRDRVNNILSWGLLDGVVITSSPCNQWIPGLIHGGCT